MHATNHDLQRLEVLRKFKQRMILLDRKENVSPFDDRVTTADGDVNAYDLPDIHADLRRRIEETIEAVRTGTKKSQVILLAGDAGTGKTHLLRTFQAKKQADQLGYIYVGGSNHWKIGEFQAQLLDWMIEALTAPSPSQNHLLLERIQAIGFRALEQLLTSPVSWRQCLSRPEKGSFRRLFRWLRAPSHDRLQSMVEASDPSVFRQLDFGRFSEYVCDRFLRDKSNLTHRYALRVLLTYLFPGSTSDGVGTRERALHWFRGRGDNKDFDRRLGATERLDRQFALFEAVKLLVHLFSPAVSEELSTPQRPCPSRVFLLVYDQAEGRDDLFDFDRVADWKQFFAHLSELYNTLPNVIVLFTMTLRLRNSLHNVMEQQFRDRIRMDEKFVLRLPTATQVQKLYQSRVENWLKTDTSLLEGYRTLGNPCAPFTPDELQEIAGPHSIRDTLTSFDKAFHRAMVEDIWLIDPEFDLLFFLNEMRKQEDEADSDFQYTAAHLTTIRKCLKAVDSWLPTESRLQVFTEEVVEEGITALKIETRDLTSPANWVRHYVVLITFKNVQSQVNEAMNLLRGKNKTRYTLWLGRATERKADIDPSRIDQIYRVVVPPTLESRLRGLIHVTEKRDAYEKEGHWPAAQTLIRKEFAGTYLGELFRQARKRLDAIQGTSTDSVEDSGSLHPFSTGDAKGEG